VAVRVERPRRLLLLAGVALLVVLAGSVVAWVAAADRGEVDDLLPNLTQAVPDNLTGRTGGTISRPRFFLGFESAAANLGVGTLMVLGRRSAGQQEMTLRQRIERSDGSTRTVPLRATLRYVRNADHEHWHVDGFMRYELRSAQGDRVTRDRKTGFCLGDRYRANLALPGRSPNAVYRNRCGRGAPDLMTINEGISIGWGDNYTPHLEGQELELTSLPAGRYVLVHRVNPTRDLRESDYSDNASSMAIELTWPRGRSLPPRIDVVGRCPLSTTCP
jgi:Lysyl oxidase